MPPHEMTFDQFATTITHRRCPVREEVRAISLNVEMDRAYVRIMHKRAIRRALRDGLTVPGHLLTYYGLI